MDNSPSPSHPTGRSVFPNPAVRQSSSHCMRRLPSVSNNSSAHLNYPLCLQNRIRRFLPSEASSFTAIVQISSEADVDESLQGPKGLARVGVAVVVHPSPHRFIHLFNKFRGRYWRPPL